MLASRWFITEFGTESTDMDVNYATPTSERLPMPRGVKQVPKKGRRKAGATMVFPVYKKGSRVARRQIPRNTKQGFKS